MSNPKENQKKRIQRCETNGCGGLHLGSFSELNRSYCRSAGINMNLQSKCSEGHGPCASASVNSGRSQQAILFFSLLFSSLLFSSLLFFPLFLASPHQRRKRTAMKNMVCEMYRVPSLTSPVMSILRLEQTLFSMDTDNRRALVTCHPWRRYMGANPSTPCSHPSSSLSSFVTCGC